MADGAGLDVQDVIVANFIPELFHCSGFALSGSATKDGTLYHGRILDYGCDWRLQEHAVLTVAEPEGKIPFVNVTYAGFVGSVTGMNAERVSIGEMGGRGTGPLGRRADGLPRPHGPRGGRRPRARHRHLPRPSADLRVLLRDRRRQDRQGGRAWRRRGTSSASIADGREPSPAAARRQGRRRCSRPATATRSWSRRVQGGPRHVRRRVGPAPDGPARRHEVEPAQRPVRAPTTRFWVANASKDGKPAAAQPYHAFTRASS